MRDDKKEILSRQRKFVVPLILASVLCFIIGAILKPGNSSFVVAAAILLFGALVVALFVNKVSEKTWVAICGGILLASIVGGILGFVLA